MPNICPALPWLLPHPVCTPILTTHTAICLVGGGRRCSRRALRQWPRMSIDDGGARGSLIRPSQPLTLRAARWRQSHAAGALRLCRRKPVKHTTYANA